MIEIIISVITIIILISSLIFSIYTHKKTLPKLRFIFYNSRYSFHRLKKRLKSGQIDDFEKAKFSMELLVINSGQKEISIIDIFSPIKQVSEIKIYTQDGDKPTYMLKNYSKKEVMKKNFGKKQHIPILNCQRLRIEFGFKLKSSSMKDQIAETSRIWKDMHNKDFIFVTSDRKKYKVNASKILAEYPKEIRNLC